ncbi:carboxypeptidase-like regulatory domain-containing protein [Hymenobacter sp. H14-R3]|uniref:carboxypeptidase-like regulatory domain-containing protein n=1 Tax=Hymenobacter sp. H14-R3 TaxID=3046308 RepID=UPI0024B9AA5F|nr:carboxypeptidase-like regulatory domain-containing protein [Hymenobacter sp. H14-R3]MDJ0366632.1 carboxypeptidase-like regulatory domain-containing protein [Hymenobacter sp. H14-R3]
MYQLVLALLLCWLALPVLAQQQLAKARQSSYLTKVFRLTEAQARRLYEQGLQSARPDFFTVPVDSFPTDQLMLRGRPLPLGYYLVAHTEGPQLVYWLRAETSRTVEVIDNQRDLSLTVRDSLGRLLPGARVAVAGRPLPYDPATHAYRRARGARPGLVAVTIDGRTTFHPLAPPAAKPRGNWAVRAGRRVVFGRPLGYLTVPMWRTAQALRHPSRATTGLVGLLRSPFSKNLRNQRQRQRQYQNQERERWLSYLLLSQPRYRPTGDTLRLKARVLRRRNGRPSTQPLTLWLGGPAAGRKRLAVLRPVRPGSYEYSLPLTDTLGLRAGTSAEVYLEDDQYVTVAKGSFLFEDYELKNDHYALRLLADKPWRGQPQAVFLRGSDANELNLPDARVRLAVLPAAAPGLLPTRRLFVPDTLWTHAQLLDPLGETRVNIPARIFPDLDLSYAVQATFLTSDNERHVETIGLPYRRDPGRLYLELGPDSVRLRFDSLGVSQPHRARLTLNLADYAPGGSPTTAVQLPLTLPLNLLATSYELRDALDRADYLYLNENNADLTLRADRRDSLRLAVANPHRLPFWYYVYQGNALRYQGYTTDYKLTIKDQSPAAWHVSLHYDWGGERRTAEYTVGAPQPQLTITTTQPDVAYPGQRLRLGIAVTDEAGRPVPNADLTAYAYTSKFGEPEPPELPRFAPRSVPGRVARQRFTLSEGFGESAATRPLAWPTWRHRLGLDSLQFYHFLYPESGAFYAYQPAPGGLAQVAAFVVDSGRVQAPIAVYVDGEPAYIHDINLNQPYTALADSGFHTLSIRTRNRLVTLREVYLRPLHKLTLSLDLNHPCAELTVEARPATLLPDELLPLRRTVVAASNTGYATLRQGNALRPLDYNTTTSGLMVAGPFQPDSVLLRYRENGQRRKFLFEPLYDYQFSPGVLKLTCLAPDHLGPLNGAGFPPNLPLGDFAYTESDFPRGPYLPYTIAGQRIIQKPPTLTNPTQTPVGQGRLELRLPLAQQPAVLPAILYTLLTRPDQPKFRRLQAGLAVLHALPPGRYRAAVLLADSTCLAPKELILVEANGQTYYQLQAADRQPAGALSHRINQLLGQLGRMIVVIPERREILVEQPTQAQPGWHLLRGRVLDHTTEEGLPGVTVLAKGTTVGTSTNADGSFSLRVPLTVQALTFSFIGFVTQELPLSPDGLFAVSMAADSKQLEEVVITGYGTMSRASLTGSVSTVLQGRAAGVFISGGPVQIRGTASLALNSEPLYIVNGLPFSGNMADIAPADILDIKVLKGPAAMGLYGSRASNGVILITLRKGAALAGQPVGPAADQLPGQDARLALRRRFRDYAWWRPTLVTDAQGRARTDVVLPDDLTSWDTFVVGSDGCGRVGTATSRLRAFKALLATLAVPRFLVAGDRAQVLGKAINYQSDTAQITTTFRVGGQVVRRQARRVSSAVIDTLTVTAPAAADSLQLTFGLEQASGYADGEQRTLPVLPVGTRERVGTYAVLTATDTTLALPLDPRLGPATLRLESDALPTLLAEIHHLQDYAYLCNEQAASRLLGLLLEQRIRAAQATPFKYPKIVNFLIKKLLDGRQQATGIWGTWAAATGSPWATVHVVEALLAAEKAGYAVKLDHNPLIAYLLHELDASLSAPTATHRYAGYFQQNDDQIRLLKLLHDLGAPAPYATYLRRIEALAPPAPRRPPLDRYLALAELRQQLGLPYQLDSLRHYRLRTALGGVFYADTLRAGTYYRYLLADRVGTSLLAYRVLRQQGGHAAELARIRTFLLGLRGGGYWGSTYEAAQILTTIGPDLLGPGPGGAMAQVQLSGSPALPAGPVTQFPLALTLPAGTGPLALRKQGGLPVYATAYQTRWNPAPEAVAATFTVATTLAGQAGRRVALPAGKPAELLITVEVAAEARYVVLEVPIPAGCSYGEPAPTNPLEVHREYLQHQAGLFIDLLPVGRHTFHIALQPRYRGSYTLNPARAELLYFPTKFGRSASKRVDIK